MKHRWTKRTVLALVALGLLAIVAWRWRLVVMAPERAVPWAEPRVERDLAEVLNDTLRVLVLRDPLTWEIRPKAVSGLEWELMERFARLLKVPVLAVPVEHPDSLWMALQTGRGDVMAAQLTPRKDHKRWVHFSDPYRKVAPVMASLRTDPQVQRPNGGSTLRAAQDSLAASAWSPFKGPGYHFAPAVCVARLPATDSTFSADDLLMELVLGHRGPVVVSEAHAAHEALRFPILEFSEPIGPPQPLAFALRRNSPELLKKMNSWLELESASGTIEQLADGYRAKRIPRSGPLRTKRSVPVTGDSISPYDAWFRVHADDMPWDWQLLAVMAYKESRFDSTAVSSKGAHGIMQLMPRTAARLGVDSTHAMEAHIGAAVKYLNKLDTLWRRAVPDGDQRLCFVLASYNAGPGHVIDAQRLAEQLGLDPRRWEHHVERTVLLLAKPRYYMRPAMKNGYCNGSQVFHYVRDVVGMYRQLKASTP